MEKYTKEQLRKIFQSPFDREAWKAIVMDIFGANKVRRENELFTDPDDPEVGYYMGSIDTPDHFHIGLFYYKINKGSVVHKKVGLRNLVRRFINQNMGEFDAALVVYNSEPEWRLSFICDIKEEATAPKRFTFVFGESDSLYRTAIERFEKLQTEEPTFENIKKAFSVDALSDDFFDEYRELYADFVQYITGKRYVKEGSKWVERVLSRPNHQFATTFENDDKLVRDYIKKMFGRIVFLYFLQRKGWLNGNRNYMHDLYAGSDKKDNFLDGVLEPLFFEVLNTEKRLRSSAARVLPGVDNIPYLNGGLFASDYIDDRTCVFPEKLFKELFDFLDSYNFTIDENDTDDAEIGIDPEMLGRIFENLLEDNKDKGAFYTPKEIVNYMCRESVIAYLNSSLPEIEEKAIRILVEHLDASQLNEKEKLDIRRRLQSVKICDPAIGSGAFPMGLVNILSKLYVAMKTDTDTKTMKRHIMEQNIYGVDIEKGAVDIARLRFWLAMIVEEPEPIPLPNLHFKIMQGNSLLESYNGIDLSDLTKVISNLKHGESRGIWDADDTERTNLINSLKKYYKASDHGERDRLFNDIIQNVRRQLYTKQIVLPSGMDPSANTDFFLWHTWFTDVFEKGGFDIVIGNPPYLEARSSSFSNALKESLQNELKAKCPNYYRNFSKGADLLIYFYELSLRIMSESGINVFITENAWLATDYGRLFQNYLIENCNISIVDSEYKYFDTADINTVVTFLKHHKGNSDNKIKFFHSKKNLKEYSCNINSEVSSSHVTIKTLDAQSDLIKTYKWSVIQKSETRLLSILNNISKRVNTKTKAKISIGQGLNLTKNKILTTPNRGTVAYFTSEDGPQYLWNAPINYVHKSNLSSTRKKPVLIMPRGIGTHFCCINECEGYTYSYVEIYGKLSREETLNIWLYCNSSLFWLLRELTGRTNLGGGMLKAEATDLKNLPLTFDFNKQKEIEEIYSEASKISVVSRFEETIVSDIHKKIDTIVFNHFDIEQEAEYIIDELKRLYFSRMKKSKT